MKYSSVSMLGYWSSQQGDYRWHQAGLGDWQCSKG